MDYFKEHSCRECVDVYSVNVYYVDGTIDGKLVILL